MGSLQVCHSSSCSCRCMAVVNQDPGGPVEHRNVDATPVSKSTWTTHQLPWTPLPPYRHALLANLQWSLHLYEAVVTGALMGQRGMQILHFP
jgi:hypothetical protein